MTYHRACLVQLCFRKQRNRKRTSYNVNTRKTDYDDGEENGHLKCNREGSVLI